MKPMRKPNRKAVWMRMIAVWWRGVERGSGSGRKENDREIFCLRFFSLKSDGFLGLGLGEPRYSRLVVHGSISMSVVDLQPLKAGFDKAYSATCLDR